MKQGRTRQVGATLAVLIGAMLMAAPAGAAVLAGEGSSTCRGPACVEADRGSGGDDDTLDDLPYRSACTSAAAKAWLNDTQVGVDATGHCRQHVGPAAETADETVHVSEDRVSVTVDGHRITVPLGR